MRKRRLLLTKWDTVVSDFYSYTDIAIHLGAKVDDSGAIILLGDKSTMSYNLNEFTKAEALADFAGRYMRLPSEYTIYEYLVD